jgi:hypothetical protein
MSDSQSIQEGRAEVAERRWFTGAFIVGRMALKRRRRRWRRRSLIEAAGLGDVRQRPGKKGGVCCV